MSSETSSQPWARARTTLIVVAGAALLAACATRPVVTPAGVSAAQLPATGVARVDRRIAKAYYEGGIPTMESLRLALKQRVDRDPQASKYAWYDLGFANFALADWRRNTDRFDAHIDAAERALEKATSMDSRFADAYALLALSWDIEISVHHWKGMVLGIKAGHAIGKAYALAPTNPRVVLFKGFSDQGTPAMFGGSKKRGRQEYARALQLFDAWRAPNPNAPTWGKALALCLLGDVARWQDHDRQARKYYHAALALYPNYKAVQGNLSQLDAKSPAPGG